MWTRLLMLLALAGLSPQASHAQQLLGRVPVPPVPPDSTPAHVWREVITECNWIYPSREYRGNGYLRNVIRLYFEGDTPREAREAAVARIGGEVIGGRRTGKGGLYLIRIHDDGTEAPLHEAIEVLRSLPHVTVAIRFYSEPWMADYLPPPTDPQRPWRHSRRALRCATFLP